MTDNSANSQAGNDAMDEQLVAYLDGELDAESSRRVEALLASNADVRRRLQMLERTWDLLDELDTAPVGEPFTQTTLEMVAVAAGEDVEREQADAPRRRRRRLWTIGGGMAAAAVVGFLLVALTAPDPNQQLLQDLPVLENFDEYRQIGEIEFLVKLRDAKLFADKSGDSPGSSAAGGVTATSGGATAANVAAAANVQNEDLSARRRRVERMTPEQKEELLRVENRFLLLPPEEREALRRLHEQLQNDPDAARLRAIMHRYCEWLKALSPLTRTEWADMAPARRVGEVQKRLLEEQRREGGRRPEGKDEQVLLRWMSQCVTLHEKQFIETLSKESKDKDEGKKWSQMNDVQRREVFWFWFWRSVQRRGPAAGFSKPPLLTDDDLARLRKQLSPEAQKTLEKLSTADQWRRVIGWIHQCLWHPGRNFAGRLSKIDDEHLLEFFEKTISDEQRERLLNMPGEEMQQELLRLYRQTRPPEGPRFRPEGPDFGPDARHGQRPGP